MPRAENRVPHNLLCSINLHLAPVAAAPGCPPPFRDGAFGDILTRNSTPSGPAERSLYAADVEAAEATSPTPPTEPPPVRTDVVIGIVTRGGKVLICQRPEGKSFAGFWEFPGGKRESGEAIEQCLRRELHEELAITVLPTHALATVDHDYPRGKIRLHPFICTHDEGETQLLACQRVLWVEPSELRDYHFPPANDALIAEAIAYLSRPADPHPG